MRRIRFAFALLFAIPGIIWAGSPDKRVAIAPSTTIILSDSDWKLGSFAFDEGEKQGAHSPQFDAKSFKTVTVPGDVQLQLGLKGMDLYYQSKELTLVNQKEWWYRKSFSTPADSEEKQVKLVFDGVDYFASVWLNGEKLGGHEGNNVPFEFNVTAKLKRGGLNHLAVKVTCPWLPKDRGFLEYLKGEFVETVPGPWIVKFPTAPYTLGPNWDGLPAGGNAVLPMGLVRDVKLVVSGFVTVEDLFVSTQSLNADGSATLNVSGLIRNTGSETVKADLDIKLAPDNFAGNSISLPRRTLDLPSGETKFSETVTVKDPHLWWTWDTGEQNLYRASATISASAASDRREVIIGIRTLVRKDDMSYWLNGKRVFLKGAWYPIGDYFASKPNRFSYEQDLEMYRAANMNHLVNFTVVEKPEFYDLCNRLGILNFFEFPFPQFGPMAVLSKDNPRREIFVKNALAQVRQIVLMLRNHPAVVEWSAFAEARMGGKGWGAIGDDFEQYGYTEFADAIGKIVTELVPGSIYHPSYCDAGEQHFWMGNAGMGTTTTYNEHFNADTGFVSEYGSIALPALESLQKMLTPEEMWGEQSPLLPRWYNLPINVAAYSYQTSFDYDGFWGVLHRIQQFVDKDIKSVKEFVEDSQLYQAFIFKYATESYRRKKYHSINGTRIWAYGEVSPGIRFNFLDYYRVPKMGYYYLKNAHERFAVNFAYEEALESQVSGKQLRIPVWLVNDYPRDVAFEIQCTISDLQGNKLWNKTYAGQIGSDGSREVGQVEWTAPEKAGVYVLRGAAVEKGGSLRAIQRTFIKIAPRLYSSPLRVLIIGQKKYSFILSKAMEVMGLGVHVIDENNIGDLAKLSNPEALRKDYDVVWLASFDSFWKLLDAAAAEGLKQAISQGLGFVHSGGPGSYHGGSIRAALLELTPLAEVLPVRLSARDDLYIAHPTKANAAGVPEAPIRDIRVAPSRTADWQVSGLEAVGLPGFNRVEMKPESEQVMSIAGSPLVVLGRFGRGRTVAYTGFTLEYLERRADWDSKILFPYLLDQDFAIRPEAVAHFDLLMRIVAAAVEKKPDAPIAEIVQTHTTPLFEMLQNQPAASVRLSASVQGKVAGGRSSAMVRLVNGSRYARLVRLATEWNASEAEAPYLVMYSDNYFDLSPGESREISLDLRLPPGSSKPLQGRIVVEGSNVAAGTIPIQLSPQ